MPTNGLQDKRVLLVEDDWLVASLVAEAFDSCGVTVIGPATTRDDALQLVREQGGFDLVLLDINLRGELSFPVADELSRRGVPFVFTTGYDADAIPPRHAAVPLYRKPFNPVELLDAELRDSD